MNAQSILNGLFTVIFFAPAMLWILIGAFLTGQDMSGVSDE